MPSGKVVWHRNMQFVGRSGSGHSLVIDTKPEFGGTDAGPSSTELVVLGLAGCTGMDVVSILRKKRVQFDDFEVAAEAEITSEVPRHMTRIEIVYRIWGADIPEEALKRSIELSQDKYCSVSNTLNGRAEITHRYEINPER
ncbi:MAG: OsmC family protein [Gemmatimonadales bacterium]|jgi:putative redox protein